MVSNYKQACKQELEHLLSREANLNAALLCSMDGLPMACAASKEIETDAISAMCSSMLSLGDALAVQGDDDTCVQVVTQSRNQTIALIHAGDDMLLVLMGSRQLKLGMLLGHARKEVEIIIELMNKSYREERQAEAAKPADARKPAMLEDLVNRVIQEAQNR
ncbi:MAG: roadblock/LC7 domain-containing protein [Mariprofundus sp.]|nr:roadblock/LC7 domain-containing protein [Mariprofundus sp.]